MSEEVVTNEAVEQEAPAAAVEESKSLDQVDGSFLPEDLRDDPSLKDFKSINDLVKSYKSSEAMLGGSIRIPGEDASEEQKTAFYAKLMKVPGVALLPEEDDQESMNSYLKSVGKAPPESADHYSIELEGVEADDPYLKSFREFAHSTGLTQEQAKASMDFIDNSQTDDAKAMNEHGVAKLKETWGGDYENRLNGANAALKMYTEK